MTSLRRRIAAAALLLAAPVAASCGFDVQTDQEYQPAVGVNDHSGDVQILNAAVVTAGADKGTVSVTFVNNGDEDDRLVSITGDDLTGGSYDVELPVGTVVNLSDKGELSLFGSAIAEGGWTSLTFAFGNGQSTTLTVPIVPNEGDFADVPQPTEPTRKTDAAGDAASSE